MTQRERDRLVVLKKAQKRLITQRQSIFQTAAKKNHRLVDEPLPPTQIGRALMELGIGWVAAHSPQAKGRIERSFLTAQDRLVKGLRVAQVNNLEGANQYLHQHFVPWWNQHLVVVAAQPAMRTGGWMPVTIWLRR